MAKSEKKPTVHQTIRIEKALMNSDMLGTHWSKGVSSKLMPQAIWKMRVEIYPGERIGNTEKRRGTVYVYIHLAGPMVDNEENFYASFQLYLIDASDGKIRVGERGSYNFGAEEKCCGGCVNHEQLKKALHDDGSLLVAADVWFPVPSDNDGVASGKESALHGGEDLQRWASKFSELYNDGASSDCAIEIGGVSIPAHKYPLMAHSPIFRSMFTHPEAQEYQSGTIKITDFTQPEPMRAVVCYCYQGLLDDATMDGDGAVEIFKLADRYCIAGLKALLEKHFAHKRLNAENVVAMAVLADTYTAPKLKVACIELIAKEGATVFESADWKELEETRPKLTTQLAIAAYCEK